MDGIENNSRRLGETPALLVGVVLVVVLVGVLIWLFLSSPVRGTLYATLITDEGVSAVDVDLDEMLLVESKELSAGSVLASIPDPAGKTTASLVSKGGETRSIVISDGEGRTRTIMDGILEAPSWSPDGGSIAFSALLEGESAEVDNWSVVRAVLNGDFISVGKGFKPHPAHNQRTFALTREGIVLLSFNGDTPAVVVASPVEVSMSTPFAVSQDGMRVAWVAPADKSLQVFENVNGYFVPELVTTEIKPETMAFSPDGKYLLGATYTETMTTLHLVKISSGRVTTVSEFSGFLRLHAWHYE
jgi:hypothetical protein